MLKINLTDSVFFKSSVDVAIVNSLGQMWYCDNPPSYYNSVGNTFTSIVFKATSVFHTKPQWIELWSDPVTKPNVDQQECWENTDSEMKVSVSVGPKSVLISFQSYFFSRG